MNNASEYAAQGWGAHPGNGLLRTAVFLIALGVAPTALAQPQTASPDPAVEPAGRIQLALLEHEERTPRRPRPEPKREADKESWSFAFDNDALVPSHRDQDYTYGLSVSYTGRDARDAWYSLNPVLGALDGQDAITDLGRRLNDLPLAPELAALVVRGRDAGLAASAARVAVLLSERMPGLDRQVDLAERLRRFTARPGDWPLLQRALSRLNGDRKDGSAPDGALGPLLADTFPDRIARRRDGEEDRYLLADGSGARLPPGSPLAGREWLVVLDTDGRPRDAVIRLAWALGPPEVPALLARHAEWRDQVAWDDKLQKVRAERRYGVGAITVESQPLPSPSPAQVEQGLLDGVRQQGLRVLPWTEATRQWRARAGWLHRLEPEHWPAMDDDTLLADLETWLLPFLAGRRALRDLKTLPLLDALKLRLGPGQAGELTRRLPERVTVASGRAVTINYEAEGGPRLAVKLQECFGMESLPALAEGRLPLTAELLTPAGRPAAITADLAGFWRNGYGQVRKELRGRYPKHPWPEDPLAAPATGRTKARGGG